MTVNKLMQILQECGDERFRDSAEVQIYDGDALVSDELDSIDVKVGVNSVDIHIPYLPNHYTTDDYDDDYDDDWDDWDDDEDDEDEEHEGLSDEEVDMDEQH